MVGLAGGSPHGPVGSARWVGRGWGSGTGTGAEGGPWPAQAQVHMVRLNLEYALAPLTAVWTESCRGDQTPDVSPSRPLARLWLPTGLGEPRLPGLGQLSPLHWGAAQVTSSLAL